jgi:Mg-chelatase subunit ChlD
MLKGPHEAFFSSNQQVPSPRASCRSAARIPRRRRTHERLSIFPRAGQDKRFTSVIGMSVDSTTSRAEVPMASILPFRRTLRAALLSAATIALLGGMTGSAHAQPQLNFKRIINNWPTIELYFSAGCKGQPAYFTDKRYFRIVENGVEIKEFELWCPDFSIRCAISVALVFDAGSGMSGAGNAGAKAAGNTFIDMMDGVVDEATVIWFNNSVAVAQPMTSGIVLLHQAVNALPATGGAAVWDAIYQGILELKKSGQNHCRGVIVLTDGQDNASTIPITEIVVLAHSTGTHIYTIGLGSSINTTQLQWIANMTGGGYYEAPTASQLVAIYAEISAIMFQSFQECMLVYRGRCMDGTRRTVDLSIVNFCGGSDTKTKYYTAPLDTSTFVPLKFRIGQAEARGGATATVPLELLDPIMPKDKFPPATFTLLFDEDCVRFESIATPPGSLLEGVPIIVTPIEGGVNIATTDAKLVEVDQIPSVLAQLSFRTSDPSGKDTVGCHLRFANWTFSERCFKTMLMDGEIIIVPRTPDLSCTFTAPPSLAWMPTLKDYAPNPFTVGMSVVNMGYREARNARFRIVYDGKDLTPVMPLSDMQPDSPRDLAPAGVMDARWDLRATPRATGDSVRICIEASFDNADPLRCCAKVWIPPAITTGIDEHALAPAEPSVFPDPSRGVLTVRVPAGAGEAVHITVIDMLGRELLRREGMSTSGEYRTSLRIDPAVPGTYYVSITGGSSRWVRAVRVY